MNKEELIDFLKEGNGIIINNVLEGNIVIDFMKENDLIYEDETSMFSLCQPQYVMYTCDKEWVCGDLKRFNDDIIAFNEVIGKDCTIIEVENLNDELLHKKKLEIESKFQYSTEEKRRNAKVVFVNIVKL